MKTVALIDDHVLIRNALKELINNFSDFEVTIEAKHGQDFIEKLHHCPAPDIVLTDINMPVMDGFATVGFIAANLPNTKTLALTVNDDDESIIKMLRAGAVGYLLKDAETAQLKLALAEVLENGYYHSELVTNTLMKTLKPQPNGLKITTLSFNGREEEFLRLACSELTYKEIADMMCVSPRTIDGYRESLFEKLTIKSRVGLVLFAIRNSLIVI